MPDASETAGTYFLGRYRVVDEIGIGGMASVHLARMDGPGGFQKWVAVKKIHSHLVEDESFVQMFLDEARVAARISHPNVATVFDLGKHEDTYWIAMEYLHGEPLREVMRRTEELGTAMPPEIACRVIADGAEGLHAAHELLGKNGEQLGLVHRDVTPHNLFVTYEGVTKVVDFGIAKFSSRMAHTRAGTLKGKLAYMSPEQVSGEGIDRRTDIFALGVVLWELTTGQRLFRMESDLDTLAKVQECNVPRPSTLIRGYPVDLEKIVMKALAKNRGERFKTAREFSRALQSLLMRRGLFIASDEVAAYTQSIFQDRIQKREAHLRWASEVTQTINVDKMLSKPNLGADYTSSEVQAAAASGKPIGAAPILPAAGRPASEDLELETGASVQTAPRPGGAPPAAPRPTARPPKPNLMTTLASPGVEPHPADGDGPTIQGVSEALEESFPTAARPPLASEAEPITMMDHPNIADMIAQASHGGGGPPVIHHDDGEDQDETLVANARGDGPHVGPSFPRAGLRPSPGAGETSRPPPMHAPPPAASAPLLAQTAHLAPQIAQQQHGFGPLPAHTGEVAFADPMSLPPIGAPMPGIHDPFGRHPSPTGPSGPEWAQHGGMGMPGAYPRALGGVPSQSHGGTMAAPRPKRRPPMWVIAALSCFIALSIAGIVLAIVSTGSGSSPRPAGSAAGSAGPFTSARAAYPGGSASTPAMTATAPPAMTAAAAPTDTVTAPPVAPPVAPPEPATATAVATATPPAPAPTPTQAPQSAATATSQPTPRPAPAPAPQPQPTAAPVSTPTSAPANNNTPAPPATTAKKGNEHPGSLTVICTPKCDQIIDNGQSLGPGHIFNRPVPAGRHVLSLSAPNGSKKNLQVEVLPEQNREVRITMDK